MNLSVIIVVVFLSTLNTLSTRCVKLKYKNNRRLGTTSCEITNIKLNPIERKILKELEGSDSEQQVVQHQNCIPNFYLKMWNTIKTLPLSSQSRLKHIFRQLVTEEERCLRISEQEAKNDDYKIVCNGIRLNKETNDCVRTHTEKPNKGNRIKIYKPNDLTLENHFEEDNTRAGSHKPQVDLYIYSKQGLLSRGEKETLLTRKMQVKSFC